MVDEGAYTRAKAPLFATNHNFQTVLALPPTCAQPRYTMRAAQKLVANKRTIGELTLELAIY